MGWDAVELNGNSEFEVILDFVTDDKTTYITHSYNENEGVYYFALKFNDEITATIVSMNSYKGLRENGWIYFKIIHEFAEPIYYNPSKEVVQSLTKINKDFNFNWRNKVNKLY